MKNKFMKQKKKIFAGLVVTILCVLFVFPMTTEAKGKSEVAKRIEKVQKQYPENSTFDNWVSAPGYSGAGCNGFVMYTTLKVFHNMYTPSCDTYNHIGKSASTNNTDEMKELFKNGKIGDVVRFRNGYQDAHFAILLSVTDEGAYFYEANFGGKNRVKYNNLWRWSVMKSWPTGGATRVDLYRSKNYNKVNKKKSAKNIKKGKMIKASGIQYVVTKNTSFGGEVKVVGIESSYYSSSMIEIPNAIFMDNMSEEGLNCNYSTMLSYRDEENVNYQLTYKVTSIGSNALRDVSAIRIWAENLKNVNKKAFTGATDGLVIEVLPSKYKKYKKLLSNKGQDVQIKIIK